MPDTIAIHELARKIAETASKPSVHRPPLPTGWPDIDRAIGGLSRGVIHEWFPEPDQRPGTASWLPPLSVMLHLARQAAAGSQGLGGPPSGSIVWIGRRIWPYPPTCGPAILDRSIFVEAKDLSERAWAADISLRCPALSAVIADGTALTMSATRRLQLAAGEGAALGLILRPPQDLRQLSAAHTRWTVAPSPSASTHRWELGLLRCKGLRLPDRTTWTLELNETGALDLVPDAADRPGSAQEIAGTATA